MLEHGGRLDEAILRYGHPRAAWLDLSTGINPQAYPVPPVPTERWQRLPEDDTALLDAAWRYYGSTALLPVAGSQAAIQTLPALFATARVGLVMPTYAEHARAWQPHRPRHLSRDDVDTALDSLDVLVLVNPNNPTGARVGADTLRRWHRRLTQRGGTLIVDEAFADADAADSLAADAGRAGLVVLRSLGKFFGLAGARVGFVLAPETVREALAERLGPWTLSGPAQYVATQALADTAWQAGMRTHLAQASTRLDALLVAHGAAPTRGCALFRWLPTPAARQWQDHLARHAIWVRAFDSPASLRIGLPGTEAGWQRLDDALRAGTRAGWRLTMETIPE
ncbi:threonine-phosphate decarboxylase [Nitrogeniibacter mangrovi]|uniref:threonine-phosphate decarboxylase n=1 Tax=Nitrogeniibacter mangrovi TaxID=2016596 RepID=A0A6C1B742_9RHOO|nr:threonine-phosphate decarboxylase CobD [Nitrogeniibacter mangrovi]QID19183.1 threonine-phosphate decarboxylase [Nitrogeniibacter mangrovi]